MDFSSDEDNSHPDIPPGHEDSDSDQEGMDLPGDLTREESTGDDAGDKTGDDNSGVDKQDAGASSDTVAKGNSII